MSAREAVSAVGGGGQSGGQAGVPAVPAGQSPTAARARSSASSSAVSPPPLLPLQARASHDPWSFGVLHYVYTTLFQRFFYMNYRRIPLTDYENVTSNRVTSMGRSLYLTGEQGKLGVWHILPKALSDAQNGEPMSDEVFDSSLSDNTYPVVLYAHGNSFDRTIEHRCMLYNVLSDMGYHVIAFDYRGYGDSEGSPTEDGIVNDTHLVYEWTKARAAGNTLIVWGHSMGTGVSCRVVRELSDAGAPPAGLVLESAFNNLHDVIHNHPFSIPVRWMPDWLFRKVIVQPMHSVGLFMNSDERIKGITCPILIMHAADDHVIPAKLGAMLKDSAVSAGRDVEYVEFEHHREFKHKFIYMAEELPAIVSKFVARVSTR